MVHWVRAGGAGQAPDFFPVSNEKTADKAITASTGSSTVMMLTGIREKLRFDFQVCRLHCAKESPDAAFLDTFVEMNYNGLEGSYFEVQRQRVERLRSKISARALTGRGLVIPSDTDLVIGSGRRIPVTILFTDITGFSRRPSSTAEEQEMMLRILNLYFSEMIRIIEDYGGTVEKNTGDGLMAYFEDSGGVAANATQRAVACSLTMDSANQLLLSPILRASTVAPIEHRVSIEHGLITIARIGPAQRFNANVAIGNAANFAAKMLAHIPVGQIGLGATACARLPEAWRQNWTELSDINTGWTYVGSQIPYPLYLYKGRWNRLI